MLNWWRLVSDHVGCSCECYTVIQPSCDLLFLLCIAERSIWVSWWWKIWIHNCLCLVLWIIHCCCSFHIAQCLHRLVILRDSMVSLFLFFFLPFYSVFSLDSPPSLLAVLLENFSIFYNDDDTKLSLSVIKDFKRKWRYFDTQAKVHSPSNNNHHLLDNF